jgi:acetyl-CoA carboxylase biotin carboxyl carrier protein
MARKAAKKTPAARKAPRAAASSVVEEVRQLVQLMVDNDLGEVDITDGDRKILVKRGAACFPAISAAALSQIPAAIAPPAPAPAPPVPAAPAEAPAEEFIEVKSPMVGTFYAAQSPDSDPYVTVGASVSEETVVCIVEAMKVMNEVRAECSGTIAEVCVRNAQPVEYGQVLYRVRPV